MTRKRHKTIVYISDPVIQDGVVTGRDFHNGDKYRVTKRPDGLYDLVMRYGGKEYTNVNSCRTGAGRAAAVTWRKIYGEDTEWDRKALEINDAKILERQIKMGLRTADGEWIR